MAAAPHISDDRERDADGSPVRIAVYDFDGTLLAGKSPVILTWHLLREGKLSGGNVALITLWGIAYKMHVPPNEAWVRERVFRAFEGERREDVDDYLARFYEEKIAHRLRPSMLEQIGRDRSRGCTIVTVSATFEPIVSHMAKLGVVDHAVATRMAIDGRGRYIARVDGLPVEGEEKLSALRRFADDRYGRGSWRLSFAYSDHYSDRPLLLAADHPVAVHPDHGLRKTALENGWDVIGG